MSPEELCLDSITGAELVERLAARLKARGDERTREASPCIDLRAGDGTWITVTLRDHHAGGTE